MFSFGNGTCTRVSSSMNKENLPPGKRKSCNCIGDSVRIQVCDFSDEKAVFSQPSIFSAISNPWR